jgi:hypothetical protein
VLIGFLILAAAIAATAGGMLIMRRRSPQGRGWFRNKEVGSGAFGAIGNPFAVLLAFVVFLAFQSYTSAGTAAEEEAAATATMMRTSELIEGAAAEKIHADLRCYAQAVINDEWPLMQSGGEVHSDAVDHWLIEFERAAGQLEVEGALEQEAFSELFAESNTRETARAERLSEADGVVPRPVWLVLLAGGLTILVYTTFFGDPRERLVTQMMMAGAVAVIIVSGLLLVAFFNHPYTESAGGLEPTAMERALSQDRVEAQLGELPCDENGRPTDGTVAAGAAS